LSVKLLAAVAEVNILPWMSRGALEYICQAGLGHSFNALDPTKENDYMDAIRTLACVNYSFSGYI